MAKSDSLFTKRESPKKRAGVGSVPESAILKNTVKDVVGGVGTLKRQSGQAAENIRAGYRKIKKAMQP